MPSFEISKAHSRKNVKVTWSPTLHYASPSLLSIHIYIHKILACPLGTEPQKNGPTLPCRLMD